MEQKPRGVIHRWWELWRSQVIFISCELWLRYCHVSVYLFLVLVKINHASDLKKRMVYYELKSPIKLSYKSPYLTLLNSMWICGSQILQKTKTKYQIQKVLHFILVSEISYLICMGLPTKKLYLTTSWPIYSLNEYLGSINLYHLTMPRYYVLVLLLIGHC